MINTNKYESNISENGPRFSAREGITFLLIGGGIGAVLALLFAPKSGRELRTDIADVSKRGYDLTLEKANEIKEHSDETLKVAKEKASEVYDFAVSKLNSGSNAVINGSSRFVDDIEAANDNLSVRARNSSIGRKPASIF